MCQHSFSWCQKIASRRERNLRSLLIRRVVSSRFDRKYSYRNAEYTCRAISYVHMPACVRHKYNFKCLLPCTAAQDLRSGEIYAICFTYISIWNVIRKIKCHSGRPLFPVRRSFSVWCMNNKCRDIRLTDNPTFRGRSQPFSIYRSSDGGLSNLFEFRKM